MISYIVEKKKAGSLSFYVSLLSGFRKMIFPDMLPAYEAFRKTNNWDIIERARGEGYKKAVDYVRSLKDMFDKDKVSSKEIEQELMTHFKI